MPEVRKMDNLANGYIRKWIVLIRALPCLQNITQGFGVEVSCLLCSTNKANLQKYRVRVQGGAEPKVLQIPSKRAEFLERCRVH